MLRNTTGILCLAALLATASASAQTSMGGVNGTVTDSTGAVVPGATVTLVERGDQRRRPCARPTRPATSRS